MTTPADAARGDGRNNPWLDLVRALAILLVLFRHGERAPAAGGDPRGVLETVFVNGWVGVDLFLVLSGYLIARHLMGAGIGRERFAFGRYLALRGLRIVPAYLAVLGLILIGAFPFYAVPQADLAQRVAYHLAFLQDYLPSDINVVFWSLGVEEKFYLLAPLLMLALLRCRTFAVQAGLLAALFVLPVALRAWSFQQLTGEIEYAAFFHAFRSPFHTTLEALVIGVAIAVAQHAGLVSPSRRTGLAVMSLSAAGLFGWLASHDFMAEIGAFDAVAQPALIALLAGGVTLGAVQLRCVAMPLTPVAREVARLSYCLYLVHFPLIPLATVVAGRDGPLTFWAYYLLASTLAAVALHLAVERPFLRLKDRLAARARPAQAAPDMAQAA